MKPEEPPSSTPDAPEDKRRISPTLATMLVIALLVIVLGGWIWYQQRPPAPSEESQVTVEATVGSDEPVSETQPVEIVDVPGDGFGIVAGLATPWAIPGGPGEPTPTPQPTATSLPVGAILLLGPPSGSFFRLDDVVSFFWTSSEAPGPGRQFVVYLVNGAEQLVLGTADSANFGRNYQLQAAPGQLVGEAGEYNWVVVLENVADAAIIGASETRAITLITGN